MFRRVIALVIFGLASFLSFPASFLWAQEKAAPRPGGTYRRPLANNPSTLDPALIADTYGFTVAQQIFDGLVQYDGSLTIVPAIADSWKGSRDGMQWTFYLRQNVKFHNGREVTADDVVYSFTRILDPRWKSKAAEVLTKIRGAREFSEGKAKRVEGLQAVDRYTVQVDLVEASAPFVTSLAIGYAKIVPREAAEVSGVAFGSRPIGTGPFRFSYWEKDKEIVLEANTDYFGGRPFLDRLEYKIYPGHRTDDMFSAFQRGELEDTFIPAAFWQQPEAAKQYRFVRRPMLGVRFIGFNTTHAPLDNRLVRLAFNHALDKEALVRDILRGRFMAGKGFLPPGTYGSDPQYRPFPYEPQRAKALLAKAGYPDGKGLPVFQVWSSVKSADVEREHDAIKQALAAVGIHVEFQYNTNWPTFNSQVYEGKYPLFRYGWVADVPEPENFLYRLFHSRSRSNLTRYRNPEVDRLLDRARVEPQILSRVELYRKVEQLVMDDAPVIPLNYYSYERLFQPYVQSIEVSALGDPYIPMRKIWLAK